MKYLLDADWAIQALLGKPYAVSTLEKLAPEGIAISWITVGELYEGAFGFANPQQHLASFREFIRPLHTYGVNDAVMERFATIRSFLRRRGQIIPDFDILLAATALEYQLTVLTFNHKHLSKIPDLRLYKTERQPTPFEQHR